jgi:hypothetical protein
MELDEVGVVVPVQLGKTTDQDEPDSPDSVNVTVCLGGGVFAKEITIGEVVGELNWPV